MPARLTAFCLLTTLACAPTPQTFLPPEPPVLEGDDTPFISLQLQWTLKGTAPDDTQVRLHLDDACRGPAWRDVTPDQLSEGLRIELASGTINVFTAVAIDARGVSSTCSSPVRARFERPPAPQRPEPRATPPLPTRETHFTIRGTAREAVTVRMFEGAACVGPPLTTLTVDDFAGPGFGVDVRPNGTRQLSFDALNLISQRSSCSPPVYLASDQQPPFVDPRLRSPTPSPEQRAIISLGLDAFRGDVFLGLGCGGGLLARCEAPWCSAFEVIFPPNAVQDWSAMAADELGNSSGCVDSLEPWRFDPNESVPPVQLTTSLPVRGLVPASNTWVYLFASPGCDSTFQYERYEPRELMVYGVYPEGRFGPSDGGLLSAAGFDGTSWYFCGNPVPWY